MKRRPRRVRFSLAGALTCTFAGSVTLPMAESMQGRGELPLLRLPHRAELPWATRSMAETFRRTLVSRASFSPHREESILVAPGRCRPRPWALYVGPPVGRMPRLVPANGPLCEGARLAWGGRHRGGSQPEATTVLFSSLARCKKHLTGRHFFLPFGRNREQSAEGSGGRPATTFGCLHR